MVIINVKEARSRLKTLLERAEGGEEITITRRGKGIAKLVPLTRRPSRLPSQKAFRASIRMKSRPLSHTVRRDRMNGRF